MASSRRRLADDERQTLRRIGRALEQGNVETLFEDGSFVNELINALYDEGVDVTVKTEYLVILEQYGLDSLDAESDQVAQRLLDVLQAQRAGSDYPRFTIQLLLTLTSLLIHNDMLKSDVCGSVVSQLWRVVSQVNDVPSRPLRACACQCLTQLETCRPGLLHRYKDKLVDMMRDERTHVFQDYSTLLSAVLTSLSSSSSSSGESIHQDSSLSGQEIVRSLSLLMDQSFLFTPAGLWPVVSAVMKVVKTTLHVSPTIFKPLMLQNLASLDPCMLHMVLYCQKEFPGDILSGEEERVLLQHLTAEVSLLTLTPSHRLLVLQWLKAYLKSSSGVLLESDVMGGLQRSLRPTVFDSLDLHVDKLTLLTSTYTSGHHTNLLRDVHYLKRLSLTTGNEWATAGLYMVLFHAYTHHHTHHLSTTIIKITQDLVVDYPHLIPLILDFLLVVRDTLDDSGMYVATLSSLHSQVMSAGQAEVLAHFRFFLQVLSTSAKQTHIQQQKTLEFLQQLVLYGEEVGACGWELGCAVLSICRNLLLHHRSDHLYYDLGELLFQIQSCFSDTEIRNRARMFYALLSSASDEKIREVLGSKLGGGVVLSENITNILTGSSKFKDKAEMLHLDNASLLHWKRVLVEPVFTTVESPSAHMHTPDVKGGLESYYKRLSHLDTKILYQYELSLDENSEYEELIAVGISLQSSSQSFSPIPDINLVSLTKSGSTEVGINLVPKLPQPSIFNIQVMFSTQSQLTVSTSLQPLEVTFDDLTLTLPWQQLGMTDPQDQQRLFDDLWILLTGDGSGERCYGVESVKVLKCTADNICQALKDFQVPSTSEGGQVGKFLLFLPPCYHVLLRVIPQDTSQVVSMATDQWKILPCLSNFLNSLEVAASS